MSRESRWIWRAPGAVLCAVLALTVTANADEQQSATRTDHAASVVPDADVSEGPMFMTEDGRIGQRSTLRKTVGVGCGQAENGCNQPIDGVNGNACDGFLQITGSFDQSCIAGGPPNRWVSIGIPFDVPTDLNGNSAAINGINYAIGTNDLGGHIFLVGGDCIGPDVSDVIVNGCDVLDDDLTFAGNSFCFPPVDISSRTHVWVLFVFRDGASFSLGYDDEGGTTSGVAYGNLDGSPLASNWEDLVNFGFGDCFCVELVDDCPPVCGNSTLEAFEECDPPDGGLTCDVDCSLPPQGACCTNGGVPGTPGTCVEKSEADCLDDPGTWLGPGTSCSECFCGPGAGDCFDPAGNGTPGCERVDCCDIVCAQLPACCEVEWDFFCAATAASDCPLCPVDNGQFPDQQGHDGIVSVVSDKSWPDGPVIVADDFVLDGAGPKTVSGVTWWGYYRGLEPVPPDCGPGDGCANDADSSCDDFEICYYNHDPINNLPVTPAFQCFQVGSNIDKDATGALIPASGGDTREFVYTAEHAAIVLDPGECYWLSVQNSTTPGADCVWVHTTAPPGSAYSWLEFAGEGSTNFWDYSWCLIGPDGLVDAGATDGGPPAGQCVGELPCPEGECDDLLTGTDEGEPCGEDLNGGCNSDGIIPDDFSPGTLGVNNKGTVWADGGTRDTDWYLYEISEAEYAEIDINGDGAILVCYEAIGEPRVGSFMIVDDGLNDFGDPETCSFDGDNQTDFFGACASGRWCDPSTIAGAGTFFSNVTEYPVQWYQFAALAGTFCSAIFDGTPCDDECGNDYSMCVQAVDATCVDGDGIPDNCDTDAGDTLEGECPPPGECSGGPQCGTPGCPQNLNQDMDPAQVNAADLAQLLGAWCSVPGCGTGLCPDLNGDGVVNAADLAQLLGAWGLCP